MNITDKEFFFKSLYVLLYELQTTGFNSRLCRESYYFQPTVENNITTAAIMRNADGKIFLSTDISVHQFDEDYPVDMRLFFDEFTEYVRTFDKIFHIQITEIGIDKCMINWR